MTTQDDEILRRLDPDDECSQCGESLMDPAKHCRDSGDCVDLCECLEHARW
jgi:hypothetical protein